MIRSIIAIFLTGIVFFSCSKDNKIYISGTIQNAKKDFLQVQEHQVSEFNYKTIDSIKIKKNGKFSFNIRSENPRFLQLRFKNGIIHLIAFPGENIIINTSEENFASDYSVLGSKESQNVKYLNVKLTQTISILDSLKSILKSDISEDQRKDIINKINQTFINHKKFIVSYVLNDLGSLSNIFALYQGVNEGSFFLNTFRDIQYFKIVNDSLTRKYPDVDYVKTLNYNTKELIDSYTKTRLLSSVKEIKSSLPEVKLPDIKGDSISLSSLKGKYVLLYFWNPALRDNISYNRQLENIYKLYKPKGFEIYQVAFSADLDKWAGLVKFEAIPWISVCDELGENSKYFSVYNIQNFPTTFLIDPTQEQILGKNLTVKKLDIKLNYILNTK